VYVYNPTLNRGMYLGSHDAKDRYKQFHFAEIHENAQTDIFGNVIHFPFTKPGETFTGSTVVVRFHDGDWIAAGKAIYRPWFINQFGLMKPADDWIRQHGFFQMIMIMLPEGNINYLCNQIDELARDGLKYGITSLQIAGWQFGGHDNGYPYYEPDSRLGTWQDMKDAIARCHQMGVKVYFFVNVQVVMLDIDWYKRELKDAAALNHLGAIDWIGGWGMGTLASRSGYTTPLMAFCNPSFPALAKAQLNYFKKIAEIGADGIHIDKVYPLAIDYNPHLTMSPDAAPWEGTIKAIDDIARECQAINPDFRISFEGRWDRFLSYGLSTWWGHVGNMVWAKRVFPELIETVLHSKPYDRLGINDATRRGFAVMVSPHKFNLSMDTPTWRDLSRYIGEINRVRNELADSVLFGEFLDTAQVAFDAALPEKVAFNTYRNLNTGKRACIITNNAMTPKKIKLLGFTENTQGKISIHAPFTDVKMEQLPAEISVAPESIVFIIEQ